MRATLPTRRAMPISPEYARQTLAGLENVARECRVLGVTPTKAFLNWRKQLAESLSDGPHKTRILTETNQMLHKHYQERI